MIPFIGLTSFICLIFGMIRPDIFNWLLKERTNRITIALVFGSIFLVALLLTPPTQSDIPIESDVSTEASNLPTPDEEPASVQDESVVSDAPVEEPHVDGDFTPDPVELPEGGTWILCTRVIDGDTIEIEDGSHVRFIGIDTPETVHPSEPIQPFGPEASEYTHDLLEGQNVYLVTDVSETDQYGRLLRYVYTEDGIFVNLALVQAGLARVTTYPPDVAHVDEYVAAQEEARENSRGFWAGDDPWGEEEISILPVVETPPEVQETPVETQVEASPDLFLDIISVSSPIRHGRDATLVANTLPGATCSIAVYYSSGASSAQGLITKQANSNGSVSWTWRVGSRTTPGSWRIVVTASLNGETVRVTTYFQVT